MGGFATGAASVVLMGGYARQIRATGSGSYFKNDERNVDIGVGYRINTFR